MCRWLHCERAGEQASRGIFAEAKTKKKKKTRKEREEEEEEEGGVGEIIIGREIRYPQGLLLIASLMSLWDVLVGDWIWIQLCRLRGVGISAHQTTARFDMDFFFSPSPSSRTLQLASPRGFRHHQKWPSCDGLASCECQNCFVAL